MPEKLKCNENNYSPPEFFKRVNEGAELMLVNKLVHTLNGICDYQK